MKWFPTPLCASPTTLWCHLLNMNMVLLTPLPIVQFPRALQLWSLLSPHLMLHSPFFSAQPVPAFWPSWFAVCQKRHCLPPGCFSMAWPGTKTEMKENIRNAIKSTLVWVVWVFFSFFLNRLLLVTTSMVLSTKLVFR